MPDRPPTRPSRLHSRVHTSESPEFFEALRPEFLRRYGVEMGEVTPYRSLQIGRTFKFRSDGKDYLFSTFGGFEKKYEPQVEIIKAVSKVGVPTISVVGTFGIDFEERIGVFLIEAPAGTPLSRILKDPAVSHEDRCTFLKQAGYAARRINSIPTKGFGPLDKDLSGHSRTWTDYVKSVIDQTVRSAKRNDVGRPVSAMAAFRRFIDKAGARFEDVVESSMTNGAIRLSTLRFQDGELSELEIFNLTKGSDPLMEIAWWEQEMGFLARHGEYQSGYVEAFFEGYGEDVSDFDQLETRLRICRALTHTHSLTTPIREQNDFQVGEICDSLTSILDGTPTKDEGMRLI